jgi:aryl-alcohol dehydrogenase-like predicted oxidoreductase
MIARAPFGRTGHRSTRTIFGAAALFEGDASDADRALDVLLSYGINHIDTAADYGKSEELVGRWMGRHRDRFFLATKASARDHDGAKESIARSLDRLRVDRVDLLQLHCLVDPGEWEQAMGPGGALEAAIEARDEGLTRFIGVTGHGLEAPAMHLKSLGRFDFDSVLLPLNYPLMRLSEYAEGFERLARECEKRSIPVQTIKAVARRAWPSEVRTSTTWYEPLTEQEDVDCAVRWVLDRSDVFLNTAGDCVLLPRILDAASRHRPGEGPSDEEMEALAVRREMSPIFPIRETG